MQKTTSEKVCATVQIFPMEYTCDYLCDFDVVPGHHPSFRATMLRGKLDQIMEMIQQRHESLVISEKTYENSGVIVTLEYRPGYFTPEHPFQDFMLWVEGLWRNGLADYHQSKRAEIQAASRC